MKRPFFQNHKMKVEITNENKPGKDGDKSESFLSKDTNQRSDADGQHRDFFEVLYRTLSSAYCMLVIAVYLVIVLNNFTKNRSKSYPEMEPTVLFLYLMGSSTIFLLYILGHLARPPHSSTNKRSHASSFLRQGSVIFGVGSLIFFSLDSASHTVNYKCIGLLRTVTGFATIAFFTLQVLFIKVLYFEFISSTNSAR